RDHKVTLGALWRLSMAYQKAGKRAEADRRLSELVDRYREKDLKSLDFAKATAQLGLSLLMQQKYAEPILRECLAIRSEKLPNDWSLFSARCLLGRALLGQKKYVEAEPLLLQGYEGMKELEKTMPAPARLRLTKATDRLVHLYEATNQPEKAKEWRAKLSECEKAYGQLKHPEAEPELVPLPRECR